MLRSVDPATAEQYAEYPAFTAAQIDAAVAAAHAAQQAWRGTSFDERARHLTEAAWLLRHRQEQYATLITREIGNRSPRPARRSTSAHGRASSTRSTVPRSWRRSR
jgi:acyl-CoA reductase-like NAD-dependent aldehyde dehydrogenase